MALCPPYLGSALQQVDHGLNNTIIDDKTRPTAAPPNPSEGIREPENFRRPGPNTTQPRPVLGAAIDLCISMRPHHLPVLTEAGLIPVDEMH